MHPSSIRSAPLLALAGGAALLSAAACQQQPQDVCDGFPSSVQLVIAADGGSPDCPNIGARSLVVTNAYGGAYFGDAADCPAGDQCSFQASPAPDGVRMGLELPDYNCGFEYFESTPAGEFDCAGPYAADGFSLSCSFIPDGGAPECDGYDATATP